MSQVTQAESKDIPEVIDLLKRCHLPQDGVHSCLATLLVSRDAGHIIGCSALEIYERVALLRSVAVNPASRSRGLGKALVLEQVEASRRHGIQEIYLLTETAPAFFQRLGFHLIERAAVALSIYASIEWTSACPASAQAMMLKLE
jgi:amino-acid N-acetyltransferase